MKSEEGLLANLVLILQSYCAKQPDPPQSIVADSQDVVDFELEDNSAVLKDLFTFLPHCAFGVVSEDECISAQKVFQAVAKLGVNMSKNMIGKQMKKLGAVHHKKQSKYMHVKLKQQDSFC